MDLMGEQVQAGGCLRDELVAPPHGGFEYCSIVSFPNSQGSFGFQSPNYHPAVGVARDEARVTRDYVSAVNLGCVATKYETWLDWTAS